MQRMSSPPASGVGPRRVLFLGATVLAALVSLALQITGAGQPPPPPPPTDIAAFEQRMAPLRALVGAGETVGYRTDPGPRNVRSVKEYMLTQYCLAPARVLEGTAPDRVVGNFHDLPPPEEEIAREGFTVEADFGNGVFLYRRAR